MIAIKPENTSVMGFKYLKPVLKEIKPARKTSRLVDWVFGLVYGSALSAGIWFSLTQPVVTTTDVLLPQTAKDSLWETLGSPQFTAWHERYQIERRAELLKAAEIDREMARDYKVLAAQSLAASLLPHTPDEDVISTTTVSVQCFDEGDLGWAAVLTQLDTHSPYQKQGTVANLAKCYSGRREAGSAIGKAGKYQPTIRE